MLLNAFLWSFCSLCFAGMKFLEDCPLQPLIPLYLLEGGLFFFYLKGKVWVSAVCGSRWNVSGRHCWMQPLIVCCSQNNFSLNSGLLKPQGQVHPEACCRDLDFSRWVLTQSFPPAAQVQCAKLRLWSDKSWRKGVTDAWLIMPLNSAIVITASLLLLF